jgi:hypothetical protein
MVDVKLNKCIQKKINKKFFESLENYRKIIHYMGCDMPIGVLCLPARIEKVLVKNGIARVYDLFSRDLTKIKGLGIVGIRNLTSRLDEFIAMG